MTAKKFLGQYAIIDRRIQSAKLQLDSITISAKRNDTQSFMQEEVNRETEILKNLIEKGNVIKVEIMGKIHQIQNDNRREILIRKYIKLESTAKISREMFISRQGVYYHLAIGQEEIRQILSGGTENENWFD